MGSKMRNPDIRRIRALAMLQRRMGNISLSAIAEEFNVRPITVSNELDWAKKQGLIQNYENQILHDLVPDAIKTVKAAVADGNVKAALEVLKGTGLLMAKPVPQSAAPAEAESLEIYVRKIGSSTSAGRDAVAALPTVSEVALDPSSATSALSAGSVVEGALVSSAATTTSSVCPDGDENHPPHNDQRLAIPTHPAGLQP